jgi:hypothetical protein
MWNQSGLATHRLMRGVHFQIRPVVKILQATRLVTRAMEGAVRTAGMVVSRSQLGRLL